MIKINRKPVPGYVNFDFDNIKFGQTMADHMFVADYEDGVWKNIRIEPYGPITFNPAMMALHYGQAIFEGMKATKTYDGVPVIFRPEEHAKRFNNSARRMAMPEFPEDLFVEAVKTLVAVDNEWIPKGDDAALYIRPFMIATDEQLGVRTSDKYKMMIICAPAGQYYSKPVKLLAESFYTRAAMGGIGYVKAAGNYAASLLPAIEAKKKGYDQVLWLDAREHKYVQEVGTMNIFFVIDGVVITPSTEEKTILKGITRDSIITILRDKGYQVVERKLSIDEVRQAHKDGTLSEIFGSGTAAVVSLVSDLSYKDEIYHLDGEYKIATLVKKEINMIRQGLKEDKFNWLYPAVIDNDVTV
ncbi:MAG TPA: branched-chain amino acid aminotransferase [Saprospiraceae bacterium]|nr:branched-chain amino acid aminotransferase [Saprospiraceae bacterium]